VDLHKWFVAIHLVLNSSEGISVRQLAKKIGVNKNTACYMLKRIQQAKTEEQELLQKLVEIERP
jgi:transposase